MIDKSIYALDALQRRVKKALRDSPVQRDEFLETRIYPLYYAKSEVAELGLAVLDGQVLALEVAAVRRFMDANWEQDRHVPITRTIIDAIL